MVDQIDDLIDQEPPPSHFEKFNKVQSERTLISEKQSKSFQISVTPCLYLVSKQRVFSGIPKSTLKDQPNIKPMAQFSVKSAMGQT